MTLKLNITRTLPLSVALLFLFSSFACGQSRNNDERPNVIVILADDLGYNDVGVYGQKNFQTPNIDQMAREGLRFTDFYAGSTVCAPSRCVLMTGQHTGRTHVRGNRKFSPTSDEPLPDSVVTIAEVLKQKGYTSAVIGKWGLGGHDTSGAPSKQGFDYAYGYLSQRHAHNYYPEFLFRNNEAVSLANEVPGDLIDGSGVATKKEIYSHDLILEEALGFLGRNSAKPFFLYFTPTLPHANNEGKDHGMEVPGQGVYKDKDWPENEKNFAAMVTLLDEGVGAIISKLKELRIADNTLVVFTSDNGPHSEGGHQHEFFDSNGEFRGRKRDLYEGGIRVPFIAWWPGKILAGQTTDHTAYLGDLMATFAELGKAVPPDNINSISFVPTLLGHADERQKKHEYLYWEFYEGGPQQAVRAGFWKAIRKPGFHGPVELYDLRSDPGEANNQARSHPDIVEKVIGMMDQAHKESSLWDPPK